jgi:hypothetical protein
MKTKVMSSFLAAAAFLCVSTFASPSEASTKTGCTITQIQYDTGRLALWCSGDSNIYYSFDAATGPSWGTTCTATATDTQKIWMSMLQTSLLAGRTVDFDWGSQSTCGNLSQITTLRVH